VQSYLARTGLAVFAMLLVITLVTERTAAGSALVNTLDPPALREVARTTLAIDAPLAVAGVERAPDPPVVIASVVVPVVVTPPAIVPPPVQNDAIVLASWYGPGFYGNRTACGQTYSPEILGVAHLTLPCGTLLTLTYGSHSLTVAVIDRGPYIVGRTLDLSNATKLALGCTDLCTLRMQLGR
jgi:hypothetical protein